jgi:Leucine-rich repeat (LRR) protein
VTQIVEEIDLSDNHVNGQLPNELGFSGLKRLVLKNNHISRTIPVGMCNMHLLEVLDLSGNNLNGPIPESFSGKSLPVLRCLYLQNNKLSGTIPDTLASIKSLLEVNLSHNIFSGPVPRQLPALSQLQMLDLSMNQIEGHLPEMFGAYFLELRVLDLSSNLLEGFLPVVFSNMSQLTYLDISQNQLKSGPNLNKSIIGLTSLTELNMSKNQFSGSIPPCFARFLQLQALDLCSNYFEGDELHRIRKPIIIIIIFKPTFVAKIGPMPLGIITFQQRRGASALRIAENNSLMFPTNLGILSLGITELALGGVGLRGEIPKEISDLQNLRVLELPDNLYFLSF